MRKLKEVTIYTDGACIKNPGPGGYGVILKYNDREKRISGGFKLTTNNRMELLAAIIGLEALKFPCSVTLYSDSEYLVNAMTKGWAQRWEANNWYRNKDEKAANPDLWERLLELCRIHQIKFVWVQGHTGDKCNEECDDIAKKAAKQPNLPVDKGYELDIKQHIF